MLYTDEELNNDRDDHSQQKPNAYRVDDDNVEEKDLEKSFLFGDGETKPVTEGQPMGGQKFGENNITPSGDDKNNPSQNAGYSNAYFSRTEPSEEHPENSNFKPDEDESYDEGTADNGNGESTQPNIPGPNEVPDQQKVGEDTGDDKYHVET
jgi:hypothetical protein